MAILIIQASVENEHESDIRELLHTLNAGEEALVSSHKTMGAFRTSFLHFLTKWNAGFSDEDAYKFGIHKTAKDGVYKVIRKK